MIVIGADTHKRNHTVVAVDGQTALLVREARTCEGEVLADDDVRDEVLEAGEPRRRPCPNAERAPSRPSLLDGGGFHAGAYVLANCSLEVFWGDGQDPSCSVEAEVTVADCGRIATLDFCAHDEASAKNALHKAHQLRDAIADFTDALEATVKDWREHQA